MQRRKERVALGFVCGAGVLALCLVAGFRVVSAAEVTLVIERFHWGSCSLVAKSLRILL